MLIHYTFPEPRHRIGLVAFIDDRLLYVKEEKSSDGEGAISLWKTDASQMLRGMLGANLDERLATWTVDSQGHPTLEDFQSSIACGRLVYSATLTSSTISSSRPSVEDLAHQLLISRLDLQRDGQLRQFRPSESTKKNLVAHLSSNLDGALLKATAKIYSIPSGPETPSTGPRDQPSQPIICITYEEDPAYTPTGERRADRFVSGANSLRSRITNVRSVLLNILVLNEDGLFTAEVLTAIHSPPKKPHQRNAGYNHVNHHELHPVRIQPASANVAAPGSSKSRESYGRLFTINDTGVAHVFDGGMWKACLAAATEQDASRLKIGKFNCNARFPTHLYNRFFSSPDGRCFFAHNGLSGLNENCTWHTPFDLERMPVDSSYSQFSLCELGIGEVTEHQRRNNPLYYDYYACKTRVVGPIAENVARTLLANGITLTSGDNDSKLVISSKGPCRVGRTGSNDDDLQLLLTEDMANPPSLLLLSAWTVQDQWATPSPIHGHGKLRFNITAQEVQELLYSYQR